MSYVLSTQTVPNPTVTVFPANVDSVAGDAALSDSLFVPSQAKFVSGLGARTLTGGNVGADVLLFAFNLNGLGDSAWQLVTGWEYALLIGGGYQNFTLGANAEAAFTGGVITIMGASTTGMNLDGSALSALSSLKVVGGTGGDVIRGGAGKDQFWASTGNDSLYLGAGDDVVEFGSAALLLTTYVEGGSGFDALRLSGGGALTDASFGNKQNIERVTLNQAAWSFVLGNAAAGAFGGLVDIDGSFLSALSPLTVDASGLTNGRLFAQGGLGADAITGGSGNDTITGGGGADTLTGGGGDDVIRFQTNGQLAASIVSGGDGFDQVVIGGDNVGLSAFALSAGAGLEQVILLAVPELPPLPAPQIVPQLSATFTNADAAAFTDGLIRVAASNAASFAAVGVGLTGTNALYVFGRSTGATEVYGGAGSDTLKAGVGVGSSNYFLAGAGNDLVRFDNGANAGLTLAAFTNASLFGGMDTDTISLGSHIATLTDAQFGANKSGWEILQFDAAGTIDVTLGANAALTFASGPTIVAPNATKLVLTNATGMGMTLNGTAFADSITGGVGSDTIIGNGGADTLKGGADSDLFRFADGNQLANATLVDGQGGEDYLHFVNGNGVTDQALSKAQNFEVISFIGTGFSQLQIGNAGAVAFSSSVISIVQGAGITQSNVSASALTTKGINFYGAIGNPDYVEGSQMTDQFFGYGGADNLRGNGGDDSFTFDTALSFSQLAYLDGGSGFDTVAIGGAGTVNDGSFGQVRNIENLVLTGASTVNLANNAAQAFSSGPVLVQAGSGAGIAVNAGAMTNNSLYAIGAGGNDTFTGSALGDVMLGGAGSDTFRFGANGGTDVVLDFKAASLVLPGGSTTLGFTWTPGPTDVFPGWTYGVNAVPNFTFSGAANTFGTVNTAFYGDNPNYVPSWTNSQTVGFLQGGQTLTVKTTGGAAFDFASAKFAAAEANGQSVSIVGFLDGTQVANSGVLPLTNAGTAAAKFDLGAAFDKVDEIRITSNGGQLAFDDLELLALADAADKLFVAGVDTAAKAQALINQATILAQFIPTGDTVLVGDNSQIVLAGIQPTMLSVNDFIFA